MLPDGFVRRSILPELAIGCCFCAGQPPACPSFLPATFTGISPSPTLLTELPAMTDSISPLYAEILGETAAIDWAELAPWFAKGQLLWVAGDLDLVAVAEA